MPWLEELTWQDARVAAEKAQLAVWPVGATEQHGPHLRVATDAAVAEAFAARIVTDLGPAAIGLPPLRIGLSEHHLAFAGTLTLRPASFLAVVADVVESLAEWGPRRVLVVNGHGGNIDALRIASRTAARDQGVELASVMWAQIAADVIAEHARSPSYGHACEIETSVAMALVPELVLGDRLVLGERYETIEGTMPPRTTVDRSTATDEWTADGALGDPTLADRALGETIRDVAEARMVAFARRFAGLDDGRDETSDDEVSTRAVTNEQAPSDEGPNGDASPSAAPDGTSTG
jgi:creatinine amidohydrolase